MPRKKQEIEKEEIQERTNEQQLEKKKQITDEKETTKRRTTTNITKKATAKKTETKKEAKPKIQKEKKVQIAEKKEVPKTRKKAQLKKENEKSKETTKNKETTKKEAATRTKKNVDDNKQTKTTKKKQPQIKTSKTTIKPEDKKQTTTNKSNQRTKSAKKKETTKALSQKEMLKMQEVVEQEIKNEKKLPQVELSKIYKNVFKELCFAIAVMIYFNFILLGFINIENTVFLTDLKVFSVSIFVVAIAIIEYAYNKESGKHAIHGIEILLLSLVTLGLVYLNIMENDKFIAITALISYLYSIYYNAKAMIIYTKMKKQSSIEKMKEMINKDNTEE